MSDGVQFIPLEAIRSPWFPDIRNDWHMPDSDKAYIAFLKNSISQNDYVAPVIVVPDGEHFLLINGHHRYYAHMESGAAEIKCIVIDSTFEQTEPLRKAEVMLKQFDYETGYRYQFSHHLSRWAAAVEHHQFLSPYKAPFRVKVRRYLGRLRNSLLGHA